MAYKKYPFFLILASLLIPLCSLGRSYAQEDFSVPREYQDLYTELNDELLRIEKLFGLEADAGPSPTFFAGVLHKENEYKNNLDEISRWKALGLRGVTLQVGFPAFYRPFYKSKEDYAAELDFYKRLSADIKALGLRLIIEAQPFNARLGGEPDKEGAQQFCRKLKFKEYVKARAVTAGIIAKELKPDYLSIINEPDTEELFSAQPVNYPQASALLVNSAIKEVRKHKVKGAKLGAGVGLWHPRYRSFLIGFARSGRLDYLDLHIYPVNLGLLERMDEASDIAAKYRKEIGCSEAWLYKCRTRESGKGINSDEVVARDAFSFWKPLDERFLADMIKMARINQFDYLAFLWPKYFYSYAGYEEIKDFPPQQAQEVLRARVNNRIAYNKYTGLADTLARLIKESEAAAK